VRTYVLIRCSRPDHPTRCDPMPGGSSKRPTFRVVFTFRTNDVRYGTKCLCVKVQRSAPVYGIYYQSVVRLCRSFGFAPGFFSISSPYMSYTSKRKTSSGELERDYDNFTPAGGAKLVREKSFDVKQYF